MCVAFLCFMAVAAVPAFIEERAIYLRERMNGAITVCVRKYRHVFSSPILRICKVIRMQTKLMRKYICEVKERYLSIKSVQIKKTSLTFLCIVPTFAY